MSSILDSRKRSTLAGGLGKDKLTGGRGNDNFRYDLLSYEGGIDGDLQIEVGDIIADFSPHFDTIQVDDVGVGGGLQEGAITQEQFQLASRAQDTSDRFIYNRSTSTLYFDSDGTGSTAQIQMATLSGNPLLNRADIVVV